jgi:transitional endoplasmic reticulum ATPase
MSENYFQFIHLKTYHAHDQLADGRKKFCRVFEQSKAHQIFFQLSFHNHQFSIDTWIANIQVKWIRVGDLREETVAYIKSTKQLISSDKDIIEHEEGIKDIPENTFTPGIYFLSATIDGISIESMDFYVMGFGEMSVTNNPYFKVERIQLFKETRNDSVEVIKKSLHQFDQDNTAKIIVEMQLKKKLTDANWYCELFASVYNEDGELKERYIVFQVVPEGKSDHLVRFELGNDDPYYWPSGNYKLQISFLGVIVAESYFTSGYRDIEGNVFSETDSRVIYKSEMQESDRNKNASFDFITEPDEKDQFPEKIDDKTAIRIAYKDDLHNVTNYLKNGLSVLIICDKIMSEIITQEVCRQADKTPVRDNLNIDTKGFLTKIRDLMEGEIFILQSFEILSDWTYGSSVIFQADDNGNLPQILAFCDASIPLKELLTRRFALMVRISGIPREIELNGKKYNPLPYLITKKEKALFRHFDPHEIYKHISGLNILQFRNAFKYVQTTFKEPAPSNEIYKALRVFKQHAHANNIEFTNESFDDIGGYEKVKKYILTVLSLFQKTQENLTHEQQVAAVPKGFILYGDPGTGKTLFAKAIANKLNATVQIVSGPEILEMWWGKSEENLRNIFATARRNAPSVIIFDEFDSIARKRGSAPDGGAMAANSLMAQLLTELDGFHPNDGVLVIATTNRIRDIDLALMRPSRLQRIFIDLPDMEARKDVARLHGKYYKIDKIIDDTLSICMKHFEAWKNSDDEPENRKIPNSFYQEIGTLFPAVAKRIEDDMINMTINTEVDFFFDFIHSLEAEKSKNGQHVEIIRVISDKVSKLREHIQADKKQTSEEIAKKSPLERDFEDLYMVLQAELSEELTTLPEDYFNYLMVLIAQFTDGWNNDQIGNLFKEAMIAHSLEGRLLSPKYFGEQIGKVKVNKQTLS